MNDKEKMMEAIRARLDEMELRKIKIIYYFVHSLGKRTADLADNARSA